MGKAHKKGKASASQKRDAFWSAVMNQKLKDVRGGLTETGIEAHTRNDEGMTPIMVAASLGKDRSLDTLLDWYERRRELRSKGWHNLKDDDSGRTAMMLAAAGGHTLCVESLLNKGANPAMKDEKGSTARDIAVERKKKKVVEAIDDFLQESDEEVDGDDAVDEDGLTSTQRNKLKKRQMQALENRGNQDDAKTTAVVVKQKKGPAGVWPEIKQIEESVRMLRPQQQITVTRATVEDVEPIALENGGTDPALWYQYTVTRMELSLPKSVLRALPGDGLERMNQLQYVILNNNSLTELPSQVSTLSNLRVLEVAGNELTVLPEGLAELTGLEMINLSNNMLTSLAGLDGCAMMATVNASNNKLSELDIDLTTMPRLHDLLLSGNELTSIPADIGTLPLLEDFTAEDNKITELPFEITKLKKVKTLKLNGNPLKDQKVKKMLQREGKGLKELWKYLNKNAPPSATAKLSASEKKKAKKSKANDKGPVSAGATPPSAVASGPSASSKAGIAKGALNGMDDLAIADAAVNAVRTRGIESDREFGVSMQDI